MRRRQRARCAVLRQVRLLFGLGQWRRVPGRLAADVRGPVVRETHSQKFPAVSLSPDRPRRPDPAPINSECVRDPSGHGAQGDSRLPAEVVLDPNEGGTFDIRIHNTSSIVDGYTVEAPNAPPWLTITQPEIRLLTDQEEVTTVTLGIRPEYAVYVQRLHLRVQICSVEDPAKRTDVELWSGGAEGRWSCDDHRGAAPSSVSGMQPAGRFRIRLDNSGSNYPQRYALTGSDPEGVVRFSFRPDIVEVAPMRVQVVDVRFDSPAPEPGQQANRTLTVTAASDEDQVEAIVNVAQETSQAPAR